MQRPGDVGHRLFATAEEREDAPALRLGQGVPGVGGGGGSRHAKDVFRHRHASTRCPILVAAGRPSQPADRRSSQVDPIDRGAPGDPLGSLPSMGAKGGV
jgi:hypothetical protein